MTKTELFQLSHSYLFAKLVPTVTLSNRPMLHYYSDYSSKKKNVAFLSLEEKKKTAKQLIYDHLVPCHTLTMICS